MAVDALVFDYDGTLVDTTDLHARTWHETLDRYGYGIGEDRLRREIGKAGSVLVPSLLGDRIEAEQGDELRDVHDRLYLDLVSRAGVNAFPCAERLLRRARNLGYRTAVCTGSGREHVERVAEVSGLDVFDLVDAVVTDSDVARGKPHPEPVVSAAEALEMSPSQCVLVGDTPFDVESARRAGGVTIGIGAGAYTSEELIAHGARTAYDDAAALGEQLDAAVRLCSPGRIRLSQDVMERLMDEALKEAREALASGNLPVGAVVTDGDGTTVSRGFSRTETTGNFLDHAEMIAFRELVGRFPLHRRELVLISTLEPCVMCYGAAMDARVETIIYGLDGPSNGGVSRCRPMQSPGMIAPRVVSGVRRDECRRLFEEWNDRSPETPFVQDLLQRA